MVLASLSSIHCIGRHSPAYKYNIRHLMHSNSASIIVLESFSREQSKLLAGRYVPPDIVDYKVEKFSGLPGLIAISTSTQADYDKMFHKNV